MEINKLVKDNQTVLILGGAAVAVIILMKKMGGKLESVFNWGTTQGEKNDQTVSENLMKDQAVRLANNNAIKQLAEELFIAMRGYGTDEDEIFRIFNKLKTPVEIKALYAAYGQRATYDGIELFGFQKKNMVQCLREDLSESEFAKIAPKLISAGLWK